MKADRFKELLDELDSNSLQTLKDKNAKYAKNGDSLYNFKAGAEIMGCTPAQACWNYMAKHLAELRGKIEANDFSDREDFLEKCQDSINYFRFLWCIGNDETNTPDPSHDGTPCIKSKPENVNEKRYEFPNDYDAKCFIESMDDVALTEHVITLRDVHIHLGMPYEDEEYHLGWHSTKDWRIVDEYFIDLPGKPTVSVIMPPPVNI